MKERRGAFCRDQGLQELELADDGFGVADACMRLDLLVDVEGGAADEVKVVLVGNGNDELMSIGSNSF